MTGMLLDERVVGAWRNTYTLAREPHRAFRSSGRVRKGGPCRRHRSLRNPPLRETVSLEGRECPQRGWEVGGKKSGEACDRRGRRRPLKRRLESQRCL